MDRSLVLKRNAVLARGTRKIDLSILRDDGVPSQLGDGEIIDAEFVELATEAPIQALVLVQPRPMPMPMPMPTFVSPGRVARATNAYAAEPVDRRPLLVIA